MAEAKLFHDVVRARHSVRAFLSTSVPDALIRDVLVDAQHAPSNCNAQPWVTPIVSGAQRDALSEAILAADDAGHVTPDFPFATANFCDIYRERTAAQGKAYYEAIGVAREDFDERHTASQLNLKFFNAPHVALLFMPPVGGNEVRVAGDLGMYGQTFLLSLTAHGLGGIPQTMLGFYADTIREELGIDPSHKLLFGISFGYPDPDSAANSYRIDKAPIEDSVTFHA